MAEINASFIPKKDIKKSRRPRGGFSVNIFLLMAIVIFLTSIGISLWVYWQQDRLERLNEESQVSLERQRDNFGIDSIKEFIELSNRLVAANEILDNHVSVSGIFDILEQDTLTDVVVSNFSFQTNPEGMVEISARGTAPTFEHVASQADVYGENEDIRDLYLLMSTETGKVVFRSVLRFRFLSHYY